VGRRRRGGEEKEGRGVIGGDRVREEGGERGDRGGKRKWESGVLTGFHSVGWRSLPNQTGEAQARQ